VCVFGVCVCVGQFRAGLVSHCAAGGFVVFVCLGFVCVWDSLERVCLVILLQVALWCVCVCVCAIVCVVVGHLVRVLGTEFAAGSFVVCVVFCVFVVFV